MGSITRLTHVVSIIFVVVAMSVVGCVSTHPSELRVLTYNIHHGEGMDDRTDLDRIASVILDADADLVALQEVDCGVERTNRIDQPQRLAELTGMRVMFGPNIDLQGGEYGNAVLSRFPIERSENHHLPRVGANEQRGLLEVHVAVGQQNVVFFATHLDHQADDGERLASVASMRTLIAQNSGCPIIVAGDFNAIPSSEVIQNATAFLRDAGAIMQLPLFSFPADHPDRRIDYIMYDHNPALKCIDYRVLPDSVSSDHRPVLATFARSGR